MRSTISSSGLAVVGVLFSAVATAQYVIKDLSFGHDGQISPNGRAIPHWHVSGEGHTPQLLSDRVILTPPAPGSTRGALWAEYGMPQQYWTAEMSFRASGQEHGSGNFQMWYVQDGKSAVGANSVYTVGKFDGLVLTVDQYGGKGGMLRGFINDGTTSYKDHHSVDGLAFGHCEFPYRNLGAYSRVRVTNDAHGFSVTIDDKPCFSTNEINLPTGNHFGMTAATADNPDSFEVSKFITSTTSAISRDEPMRSQPRHQQQTQEHHLPNAPEQVADADPSTVRRQEEQFADLHNRLQALSHQINEMFGEFEKLGRTVSEKHNDIVNKLPASSESSIGALSRRLENIERGLARVQKDVEGRDYQQHFSNLQQAVEGVRGGIHENLPDTLKTSKSTSCRNYPRVY